MSARRGMQEDVNDVFDVNEVALLLTVGEAVFVTL